MSFSIASFSPEDIITSPQTVIDAVNHSCRERGIPKKIQAVCHVGDSVHFVLRHCDRPTRRDYTLVELTDTTQADFAAAVNSRFQGSTDIVGAFTARGVSFAIFTSIRANE
ncbi:MAG: hypothetical protein RRC34_12520 [Lentisphaeria bacterium]|nr:hypothetical protein [Lentisphaeria bacterium]